MPTVTKKTWKRNEVKNAPPEISKIRVHLRCQSTTTRRSDFHRVRWMGPRAPDDLPLGAHQEFARRLDDLRRPAPDLRRDLAEELESDDPA